MAGANHPKFSQNSNNNNNNKPSSSSQRKSRWETAAPNPNPNPNPNHNLPNPNFSPQTLSSPKQDVYGFHMLERRTIVLADRSVRTYLALPPDYQDLPGRRFRHWDGSASASAPAPAPAKRKHPEDDDDDHLGRQRQQLLQFGNPSKMMRTLDPNLLKKSFLHFVKLVYESPALRKSYLDDGKRGPLKCIACGTGRSSKDFPDMHGLIMHTYNSDNADLRVDHLGLHKALCTLMGWNYSHPPDNSKAYKFFPAAEAATNQDDLIMWPPMVIIHNTNTGKGRDGRMEGLGNKAMDSKIRDLGFGSGRSKSLYGRDGHLGITLVKFNADQSGLKDATRLAEYFERDNHGRKSWSRVESNMTTGKDNDKNPNLVKVDERTGERTRILYGYLGTACDLDKVDFDTRKKAVIESKREHRSFR